LITERKYATMETYEKNHYYKIGGESGKMSCAIKLSTSVVCA